MGLGRDRGKLRPGSWLQLTIFSALGAWGAKLPGASHCGHGPCPGHLEAWREVGRATVGILLPVHSPAPSIFLLPLVTSLLGSLLSFPNEYYSFPQSFPFILWDIVSLLLWPPHFPAPIPLWLPSVHCMYQIPNNHWSWVLSPNKPSPCIFLPVCLASRHVLCPCSCPSAEPHIPLSSAFSPPVPLILPSHSTVICVAVILLTHYCQPQGMNHPG